MASNATPDMASNAAPAAVAPKTVSLFVPRGMANEDPNVMIGINGKNWLLPKGKTSEVPDFVAAEYHRSQKAQTAFYNKIDELVGKANESARAAHMMV